MITSYNCTSNLQNLGYLFVEYLAIIQEYCTLSFKINDDNEICGSLIKGRLSALLGCLVIIHSLILFISVSFSDSFESLPNKNDENKKHYYNIKIKI